MIIPAIAAHLLTGIWLAIGIIWIVLVPTEMLGVSAGLSYYILDTRDRLAYFELMAVILIIGAIGYLLDAGLRLVIEHDGKVLAARVIFAHLQVGQSERLTGTCRVWGYPVAVEALRLEDGGLLVVIAPVKTQGLVQDYALRWGIETLFGIFKTRGFCLESTHFSASPN